ncbi:hypothetical protein ACIBBB_08175 [Streptomyces sp. NPDC051217]|uniref:hypothetical protein n=1 Tax=Streptomyces sp. NPDC051217 TaxID=3365644 RepID=UPI0037AD3994
MSSQPTAAHAAPRRRGGAGRIVRGVVRVLAAAALALDAYYHADLAPQYDGISEDISQGDLFRIEAGLSALAALLVLVWRRFLGDAFAWAVAAGGLALLLVYRYVDVGVLGPFPNMYEPIWFGEKQATVAVEAVAVVATAYLLIFRPRSRRMY